MNRNNIKVVKLMAHNCRDDIIRYDDEIITSDDALYNVRYV